MSTVFAQQILSDGTTPLKKIVAPDAIYRLLAVHFTGFFVLLRRVIYISLGEKYQIVQPKSLGHPLYLKWLLYSNLSILLSWVYVLSGVHSVGQECGESASCETGRFPCFTMEWMTLLFALSTTEVSNRVR